MTECDYLYGWIEKQSHTQKSHPQMVNSRDDRMWLPLWLDRETVTYAEISPPKWWAPEMTECDYLYGWIEKQSHMQKSHPQNVELQRSSWECRRKRIRVQKASSSQNGYSWLQRVYISVIVDAIGVIVGLVILWAHVSMLYILMW